MNSTIKPIQTRYKNCNFRSRTEARWAVFFDALGVIWEYEKEGFELSVWRYLPDFWLPQVKMWAEVKPGEFSEHERKLCRLLANGTGSPCLLLDGMPADRPFSAFEIDFEGDEVLSTYSLTNEHGYVIDEGRFFGCPANDEKFEDTADAVAAALSARFEFGETPQ